MTLTRDCKTGKLSLDGKEIGEAHQQDGKWSVRFTIEYQTAEDDWFAPIVSLSAALRNFPEYARPKPDLTYKMCKDAVEEEFDYPQTLTEKKIRSRGYVWMFYKNDEDPWPSLLHGHDYDNHLKLDAITGVAFDVGTKEKRFTLKKKELKIIQSELQASKDFKDKFQKYIHLVV